MAGHEAPTHRGRGYHIPWELNAGRATVWNAEMLPVRPNMYAFGAELRKWMRGEPYATPALPSREGVFTNPYTEDASVLTAAYMRATNDGGDWGLHDRSSMTWVSGEIRRIRLYTEFVLYTVRLTEALVKQLLFCTNFQPKSYAPLSLGELLFVDCKACRRAKNPHMTSFLGSLAHHYRLCRGYDNCLDKDLPLLNRLRNKLAAHAGTWEIRYVPTSHSRKQLVADSLETGKAFVHMLEHIGEIELAMRDDIFAHMRQHASIG
jgi:hypothetical protein